MSPLPAWLPIIYLVLHSILVVLARHQTERSKLRILVVNVILLTVFGIILAANSSESAASGGLERVLLLWGPVVFFWWAYLWTRNILNAIHPPGRSIDLFLIRLEERIGQPSLRWAQKGNRILCEILHIGYNSYYLYTLGLGLYLQLSGEISQFQAMTFAVMLGYLVSYITFALIPADGPRWALVERGLMRPEEQRMRGFAVTEFTNRLMFEGPALKGGAMPSSHSSTAVVFLIWCWRIWGPEAGVAALILVLTMWLGSVYGRYHFVLDIIAGGLLGWGAVLVADSLIPM
jgi:membrane-associated phospholipid phosphatase